MAHAYDDLLECPVTRRPLAPASDGGLVAEGGPVHPVTDGIACFLPETLRAQAREDDASKNVRDFYQTEGWVQGEDGLYADSRAFVDMRSVAHDFETACIKRLGRHFKTGGKYLLDAGSGPIPHEALLSYGGKFDKRICVDLSVQGLKAAKAKLGERGVYLQADISRLPIRDNSVDAITCNHVLYQIPAEMQKDAFLELWRVLKPGGVAVIVYWWPETPLARRLERAARLMRRLTGMHNAPPDRGEAPEIYHHPHSLDWFTSQDWPFKYKFDTLRVISNTFTQYNISDDWRGRLFLGGVMALQRIAPAYCGRNGLMPAIVIRKDASGGA